MPPGCSAASDAPAHPVLVFVPFTRFDMSAVERSQAVWQRLPPCTGQQGASEASRPGLMYLYNGRCGENGSDTCARVERIISSTAVTSCFRPPLVRGARLSGKSDTYDKQRRSAAWTAGPNNLWHRAASKARRLGYWYMLQLEPDVLPLRAGWLDRVQCITQMSDAWIIGSALRANCTREETTQQCVRDLPEEFAEHINGNAIYAVGDNEFAQYSAQIRTGRLSRLPFDLALHIARQQYSQSRRRQMAHQFEHNGFMINMGTDLPDVHALRARHAQSFLVHSSAFSKLGAGALQALFGVSQPSVSPPPPSASQSSGGAHIDLEPLRLRAGPDKLALAAFVAGSGYRELLRNFLSHVHRAKLRKYVLVALDTASTQHLSAEGEPVVDASRLVQLPSGGSDEFGSAAFFAVNGARYGALLAMLRAGFSLFVVDLDVAVLRDPLQWLRGEAGAAHHLLIQSDARDGLTTREYDPDLLTRRLGLSGSDGWRYANGGVFYCRATAGTVALFRGLWDQLSAAKVAPNEQDLLNRALASTTDVRWDLLPATLFPNGFVYFYRTVPAPGGPVLVHCNWVNGVKEKVYHLSQAGLWALPPPPAPPAQRYLSYARGIDHGPDGIACIAAHRRALRDALAIARALGRTLILPHLPLLPGQVSPRSLVLSHFFDLTAFARHFPEHSGPGVTADGAQTKRVHLDVGRGDEPLRSSGFEVVRHETRGRPSAITDRDIRRSLAPYESVPVLHLWTPYRRFGGRLAKPAEQKDFAERVHLGLQPAPRLALLVRHVTRSLRSAIGHRYDCIDVSMGREYTAVLSGGARGASSTVEALMRAAVGRLGDSQRKVLVVSDAPSDAQARAVAARHLPGRSLWMDEHVPRWLVTDYDLPSSNRTSARAMIELLTCAKGERFVGNVAAQSTHTVCSQRHASRKSSRSTCEDAFGRQVVPPRWSFF